MDLTHYHPGVSDDAVNLITRMLLRPIPERQRSHDLSVVVRAILHRTAQGCTWRALDCPTMPWSVVYYYFRDWNRTGVIDRVNALIV